MKNPGGAHSIL